ncbi:VWA domain-containing protein [Streptomyces sp. NBC_00879]|uniref:VWA domain-containing protein n=1 Tax=Streptomyces sp. NBC_00879 TaxID=2975855 RepID=UPI00386F9789|nr:VWA domain-containing protein [Streptomyces sp. NBC_00879]
MQLRSKAGALVVTGVLLAISGPPNATATEPARAPGAAEAATAAAAEGPDPIDFAVVVDQSKSLADKDLIREVEAAALLSQGEISERSRAAVIGFGSSEKAGQSPVREVCGLTVADAAGRQRLSDCVQQLSHRDPQHTGPGTDFPAAVRQAVDRLSEGADSAVPKVVFLLTDGKLDVSDSPEYGTDAASRQANGAKRLTEELARARSESVQIWPLGFGSEIDKAALTAMAEGGYRNGCADLPGATPRMRVVDSSAEIDKALQETFAAARCAQIAHGTVGKPPADLTVTIPPIATDGSITVSKHDPKVSVTYYDPSGRKVPTQGEFDGSTFETSGQDGPVEALRVKNPLPGRWRVHVEAPEGHRDREVAVRAIWQGRLRSAVTLDPASPRAGERAVVEVRMQTRRGVVVTDPRQLAGVKVSARLSGTGFAPVTVSLVDDGREPDRQARDVRFTGTLTVPAGASGDLELTTQMAAPGVTSDHRPLHARVTSGTEKVTAGLTVERKTVHPGDTVEGTLDVTNNDTVPHTLRLALDDQSPGSAVRISPATVAAAPGERTRARFTLSLGAGTPLGEVGGGITVVDTGDGGRVLDTSFLDVRVEAPPTWWDRWWGPVTGGAALALLLAAFAVLRFAARRRRRDLSGVQLELSSDGRALDELTIRSGQSTGGEFHFTVDRARGAAPALQRSTPGASGAHRLRRTGGGELLLRPHQGRESAVRAGEATGIADGLELVVRDRRAPAARPSRGAWSGSGRGRGHGGSGSGRGGGRDGRTEGEAGSAQPRGRWSRPRRGGDAPERPRPEADPAGSGEHPAGARRFDPNF